MGVDPLSHEHRMATLLRGGAISDYSKLMQIRSIRRDIWRIK